VTVSSYRDFRNKLPIEVRGVKIQTVSKKAEKFILPHLRSLLQNPQRFKYRGGSSYYADDSQYFQAISDKNTETEALFILRRESYRKYIRPQMERGQVIACKEKKNISFGSIKETRFIRRFGLII